MFDIPKEQLTEKRFTAEEMAQLGELKQKTAINRHYALALAKSMESSNFKLFWKSAVRNVKSTAGIRFSSKA